MPASEEHLDELLLCCMNFARKRLEEAGDFYPHGAVLAANGELEDAPAYPEGKRPQPHEVYDFLMSAFKAGAGEGRYLGVALVANVNIPEQFEPAAPEGIRVLVETHGYARYVYMPYRINAGESGEGRRLQLFAPFSVQVPPEIYPRLH